MPGEISIRDLLRRQTIRFTSQAMRLEEALPFGNGCFGGLVHRPAHWEWTVAKLDVDVDTHKDYRRDRDPANFVCHRRKVEFSPPFAEILEAVRRKNAVRLARLEDEKIKAWRAADIMLKDVRRLPVGNAINVVPAWLRIALTGAGCQAFREELNLYRGVVTADCVDDGVPYQIETVCDPDQDVYAVTLSAGQRVLPIRSIALARPAHPVLHSRKGPGFDAAGDYLWVDYEFDNHFRYVVMLRLVGGRWRIRRDNAQAWAVPLTSVNTVTVYVACVTCLETDQPVAFCRDLLAQAELRDIRRRNAKHWHQFWSQSAVQLGDEITENLYYMAQYAFACTHGGGMKAAYKGSGLYGLWTAEDHIVWQNRVYEDVNIEMAYQHVFSSNHLPLFEGFVNLVWASLPTAQLRAHKVFGLPGACFSDRWHCAGPWYCSLLWDYYTHSQDVGYLREKAWPIMKAVADFYAAFLRRDRNGRYSMFGSAPPERGDLLVGRTDTEGFGGYYRNVTIDLALLKALFRHMIAAARVLRRDLPRIPVWREILRRFPVYPTGWTRYGRTIFEADEYNEPTMCLHPNTVTVVYPAREFHFSSPKPAAALGAATVQSCWDNLAMNYTFSNPWVALTMARMGLGRKAAEVLSRWVVDVFASPSGFLGREIQENYVPYAPFIFGHHPGNPPLLETGCGLVAAINEMLLQEHEGTLFVFPALPPDWKHAAFQRLRTPGGFLVSGTYADGRVMEVAIQAEHGGAVRLQNPWPAQPIILRTGGRTLRKTYGARIPLTFAAGQTIAFQARARPFSPACPAATRRPKEKVTVFGRRLFIGKDARSRVIEAVDRFTAPFLGWFNTHFTVAGGEMEGPRHRHLLEIPNNIIFKFDFGAGRLQDYDAHFQRQPIGDVPFTPIAPDTRYDPCLRFGWERPVGLKVIKTPAAEPLSRSAIAGTRAQGFRLRLNAGFYRFLLLYGSEAMRVAFSVSSAIHRLPAATSREVGMEEIGLRVPAEEPLTIIFRGDRIRHWQVHALLVKREW